MASAYDASEFNVLYSSQGFIKNLERSNLIRLEIKNGCHNKWSANTVLENDLISGFKQTETDLTAWTLHGIELKLDERTGNILYYQLVK